MPNCRQPDFLGIAGADGGDGVGAGKAGLQEAHAAIIFDAVDAIGAGRQAQRIEDAAVEPALEGDIVDGDDAGGAGPGPGAKRR